MPRCTLGRRKCTKVLPKRAVLHPRATESVGFVAEESPSSLRHSALHLSATKMRGSVTQACRTLLSGDENARQCCPSVSCCTLGRRKCTKVLPKRAALHPRATNSVGFVAEESPSSLRHSVLHLWASIMDRSVTQACRAALLGDENVRKCCLSVPRYTLGRRKCSEVSPKRAVLYPRATNSMGFVAEESHSSGTRRGTAPLGCVVERHRGFYLMWLYWLYHVEGGEEAAVGGGFLFQG